jgi:hypothetical protein
MTIEKPTWTVYNSEEGSFRRTRRHSRPDTRMIVCRVGEVEIANHSF